MSSIEMMPIATDLAEVSFSEAVASLGVLPERVDLICSVGNAATAQKLRDQFRCAVHLIPRELIVDENAWGVRSADGRLVYSLGA